jgi:hypothetical protein
LKQDVVPQPSEVPAGLERRPGRDPLPQASEIALVSAIGGVLLRDGKKL